MYLSSLVVLQGTHQMTSTSSYGWLELEEVLLKESILRSGITTLLVGSSGWMVREAAPC